MKNIKTLICGLIAGSLLVTLIGCNSNSAKTTSELAETKSIKVVTTLFPQYDFVREIAKDKVAVSLLLPPGVESHSFEPTPKDIADIGKADMFIYTGKYMEPWADRIIENVNGKILVVDTSIGTDLIDEDTHKDEDAHQHKHEHEDKHEHEHHGGKDPHIWTDPIIAQKMVDNIVAGFIAIDAENESFYKENGEAYKKKLQQLHEKFVETFTRTKYNKIMYGGHFAFGYFAKRYGLEHISPYSGFAPNAEPTPQRIVELIKNIEKSGINTIYYEELVDPKVARVIADQTGAQMLLLHGAHNVSKDELASGISYLEIMEGNLKRLKIGLVYNE